MADAKVDSVEPHTLSELVYKPCRYIGKARVLGEHDQAHLCFYEIVSYNDTAKRITVRSAVSHVTSKGTFRSIQYLDVGESFLPEYVEKKFAGLDFDAIKGDKTKFYILWGGNKVQLMQWGNNVNG